MRLALSLQPACSAVQLARFAKPPEIVVRRGCGGWKLGFWEIGVLGKTLHLLISTGGAPLSGSMCRFRRVSCLVPCVGFDGWVFLFDFGVLANSFTCRIRQLEPVVSLAGCRNREPGQKAPLRETGNRDKKLHLLISTSGAAARFCVHVRIAALACGLELGSALLPSPGKACSGMPAALPLSCGGCPADRPTARPPGRPFGRPPGRQTARTAAAAAIRERRAIGHAVPRPNRASGNPLPLACPSLAGQRDRTSPSTHARRILAQASLALARGRPCPSTRPRPHCSTHTGCGLARPLAHTLVPRPSRSPPTENTCLVLSAAMAGDQNRETSVLCRPARLQA